MNKTLTKSSFFDDILGEEEASFNDIKVQLTKAGKVRQTKSKSIENLPLSDKLKSIEKEVRRVLGRYYGFVRCIRDEKEFTEYIDKAISHIYLSFDTETNNSLDPLTCKLMGLCLYIPNTRPVYVPINHTKPGTDELLPNQVSEEYAKKEMERLRDSGVSLIYHNGKFDIRVIWNTLGVRLPIWWDTMIASQLLDENVPAKLKYQYKLHVDATIGTYNIESLFAGIPYAWVDPDIFALYAATDAYDTYKLQQYQQSIFEQEDLTRLYKLFREIEVPIVSVVAKMEDYGICMDLDYIKKLNEKYTKLCNKYYAEMSDILSHHTKEIEYYQSNKKLDNPINFNSPSQLQIVLYDILKEKVVDVDDSDDEDNSSTGASVLKAINSPFTNALLEYRHYYKLLTSFVDALPKHISTRDNRLHAGFNQMGEEEKGVRTGRFSSKDPNLQNIPSKEISLRLAFKASDGFCIIGSDFSSQEPRLLAHMSNDPALRKNFEENRDVYATVGQFIFHKDYWDCMEAHQDGTPNPEGKKLRKKSKGVLLGTMYGMGAKKMAMTLGISVDECKQILDEFFKMFPRIREFKEYNETLAKEKGYVEDYLGRIRHLPDTQKKEIEIKEKKKVFTDVDVFMGFSKNDCVLEVPDEELALLWERKYMDFVESGRWSAKKDFRKLASDNNIKVYDNGAFISKAMRQSVNSVIQGGAASLTKKAMIAIDNDPVMQKCGFRLMIPVHDELLGECPIENRDIVEKRLTELMISSALPECTVEMKCDAYVVKHWYEDEVFNQIHETFEKSIEKGKTKEQVIDSLRKEYPELKEETLRKMCDGTFDVLEEDV
ncbi:MAG: hypothetical protein J6S67_16845 [Methanobrevibacter sp.]|nr:hypothetical protein [Methanobrevibacter sp.]